MLKLILIKPILSLSFFIIVSMEYLLSFFLPFLSSFICKWISFANEFHSFSLVFAREWEQQQSPSFWQKNLQHFEQCFELQQTKRFHSPNYYLEGRSKLLGGFIIFPFCLNWDYDRKKCKIIIVEIISLECSTNSEPSLDVQIKMWLKLKIVESYKLFRWSVSNLYDRDNKFNCCHWKLSFPPAATASLVVVAVAVVAVQKIFLFAPNIQILISQGIHS